MAYFLGRDVKVWITTEDASIGIKENSNELITASTTSVSSTAFANKLHSGSVEDTYAYADITGVDIGLGVTDEDISYMGLRSVLKAEIKKETAFNGPCSSSNTESGSSAQSARWGVSTVDSAAKISSGTKSPKDHTDGTNVTFGFRVHVQLKGSTEVISVPACQITGHSITLNADGTTEETLEFMSHADPLIAATANTSTRMSSSTI
jgi:hypothetical protein